MTPVDLNHIATAVRALPALPRVVMELIESLRDEDCDVDRIASQIARDPGISAKTLRLANSSFFGLQRSVASVDQAVTVLGFSAVRNIATTAGLMRSAEALPARALDLDAFWRHSLATALCARELASRSLQNAALAYTCGLLHDLGKLVLDSAVPDMYAALLQASSYRAEPTVQSERSFLGVDHAQAGREVLRHWQFPSEIQDAVALHHSCDETLPPMAALVMAADAVVQAMDVVPTTWAAVPVMAPDLWDQLGLGEEQIVHVMQQSNLALAGAQLLIGH